MKDVPTALDQLEIRCPRLGGPVQFLYCRKVAEGLPCSRSLVCWEAIFPIERYMAGALDEDEWRRVFVEPSPGRLDRVLEAAHRAQRTNEDD